MTNLLEMMLNLEEMLHDSFAFVYNLGVLGILVALL